jgi:hypothetical protein
MADNGQSALPTNAARVAPVVHRIDQRLHPDDYRCVERSDAPLERLGQKSPDYCNFSMKQKPRIETTPYLRDPEKFRKALITSVASSTVIEASASRRKHRSHAGSKHKNAPLTKPQASSALPHK